MHPTYHPNYRKFNQEKHDWRDDINDAERLTLASGRIILIGTEQHRIEVDGSSKRLHPTPYNILLELAKLPDEPHTYKQIVEAVYGWEEASDTLVESFRTGIKASIQEIRGKLGTDLGDVEYGAIRTIPGIGYLALSDI